MSTKWSHLPNAHLIDWVLESLKTNPEAWDAAWDAAGAAAWDATREADAAWEAAYEALAEADAAWEAVWEAERAARPARDAAWDAIMALIVDDTAAQYLHMGPDKLKVWVILSEKPAAYLLIPANQIWQREHARAVVHE